VGVVGFGVTVDPGVPTVFLWLRGLSAHPVLLRWLQSNNARRKRFTLGSEQPSNNEARLGIHSILTANDSGYSAAETWQ
jgi:hypothetical protein